ncbi:MAG TPA: hypothetical protein VIH57_19655 [Bacteroidales bacterium]
MKETLLIILICILKIQFILADDAPLCHVPGGTVKPISNSDIQMYSETIDITLLADYYTVEVNYVFVNKGKAQKVVMGFPSSSDNDMHFKAYENDSELEITKMKSDWNYIPGSGNGCQYITSPFDQFECQTVFFNENETKHIKNTYQQRYNPSYRDEPITSFYYVLVTGAFWRENISTVEVRLHTDNAPFYFDLENGSTLNNEKVSLVNFYRKLTNLKPKEDLSFGVTYKDTYIPFTEDSVLKPSGNINYEVLNLIDGKKGTAWVEGYKGSGIGSKIEFYNPSGSAHIIKSMDIVNGCAKSDKIFNDNNRVSCIKLTINYNVSKAFIGGYYEGLKEDFNDKVVTKVEYIFNLKDTPLSQRIIFNFPIPTTSLTIEILDVFKGDKYDDTGISEIKFNYDK